MDVQTERRKKWTCIEISTDLSEKSEDHMYVGVPFYSSTKSNVHTMLHFQKVQMEEDKKGKKNKEENGILLQQLIFLTTIFKGKWTFSVLRKKRSTIVLVPLRTNQLLFELLFLLLLNTPLYDLRGSSIILVNLTCCGVKLNYSF